MKKSRKLAILMLSAFMTAGSGMTVFAGQWEQIGSDWKYMQDNGTYAANGWYSVDCKYYYFDGNGIMLSNTTTPDGESVNENGAWVKNGKAHVAEYSDTKTDWTVLPTTIAAESATLADTGLSGFIGETDNVISNALGESETCAGADQYMFPSRPAAVFKISPTTNAGNVCITIEGPFAAFFTCSGSDVITKEQIEQALGVQVSIGMAWYEERWYANFVYNGNGYSIFSCTPDGTIRGDSSVSVTKHIVLEQDTGFYDTSGQWLSI